MRIAIHFVLFVGFVAMFAVKGFCQIPEWPTATLTVTVSNEAGTPLSGANVIGVFTWPRTFQQRATRVDKKLTDSFGRASVGSKTDGICSIEAKKKGFYFSGRAVNLKSSENGKWLPSPKVERLLLKEVGIPVPMYAVAKWAITLPEAEGSFGFDLEKRDWVAPHGVGVISDLVLTQEKKVDNVLGSGAALRISFPNRGDGLIPLYELKGAESELKLPRTAPADGYETERRFTTDWNANRQQTPPARPALGYFYRVRTVLDNKGRVKSAWYGKIDGEFEWDPRYFSTGQITFTYYLNPDGTRNLEFDRKKNLFEELPIENAVRHP